MHVAAGGGAVLAGRRPAGAGRAAVMYTVLQRIVGLICVEGVRRLGQKTENTHELTLSMLNIAIISY